MRSTRAATALLLALALGGCHKLPRPMQSTAHAELGAQSLAQLWQAPEAGRDLYHGPGGASLRPAEGASFRLVSRKQGGFSPGWDVVDANGIEWSAKGGPEAQSEVAASRIVWAAGYHQPPIYFVRQWAIEGSTEQTMPARFRPKLPDLRRGGAWSWHQNPFVGTRELDGLLVLMRLVNNWDLLERNNAVYANASGTGPARMYVVQDLGAAFGRTRLLGRDSSRNDVDDFEQQPFVKGVSRDGHVRFDDLGRWHRELFRGIPAEHARWACGLLATLGDEQWSDAFRTAGYDPAVAERYVRKLKEKVSACGALR